jgi:sortase A
MTPSWHPIMRVLLSSLGVFMIMTGIYLFFDTETHDSHVMYVDEQVHMAKEAARTPGVPVRLLIPSIHVSADIQHVGLVPGNMATMDVPDNFTDVGWYKEGPRPGMVGSAVIDGHLNGKNVPEAVFYRLDSLVIGDSIYVVDAEMKVLKFRVVAVRMYAHDDETDDVFTNTEGKAHLNLITCAGTWMKDAALYDKRTVVFTELVSD